MEHHYKGELIISHVVIEKTDLSDYLLEIAGEFILYLDKRKSKTGKFLEFSKAKLRKKISLKEVWQILLYLEEKGLALLSNNDLTSL